MASAPKRLSARALPAGQVGRLGLRRLPSRLLPQHAGVETIFLQCFTPSVTSSPGEVTQGVQQKASDTAAVAKDSAASTADSTQQAVAGTAQRAKQAAADASEGTKQAAAPYVEGAKGGAGDAAATAKAGAEVGCLLSPLS